MNQTIIQSGRELVSLITAHLQAAALLGKIPLLVVMGPTASGKTALGIALAKHFNGEIISADSRQLYREMAIGTAQPSASEMKGVRHYLIDEIYPNEEFNLAAFQKKTEQYIEEIIRRKKTPLLVGGTGLYVSAITQNYQLPESKPDLKLRRRLEKIAFEKGREHVHRMLEKINPQAAGKIPPQNLRYVIRAIEIAGQTRVRPSANEAASPYHSFLLTIEWPRDLLYERIERRVDAQIRAGLIDETKKLMAKYSENLPSISSLGYREIGQYLGGGVTRAEAVSLFKKNTRNFAKRQMTWFRKFPQVYSIPGTGLSRIILEIAGINKE